MGEGMSRSLHTQKLTVRALRRLARPYGKRREDAVRISGRKPVDAVPDQPQLSIARKGTAPGDEQAPSDRAVPLRLSITRQKSLPGSWYPVSPQDIRDLI